MWMNGDGNPVPAVALAALLVVLLAGIGCWDIFCSYKFGREYTVSWILQGWGRAWPVLPLLIGLVLGHLFWPQGVNIVP